MKEYEKEIQNKEDIEQKKRQTKGGKAWTFHSGQNSNILKFFFFQWEWGLNNIYIFHEKQIY